MRTLRDLDDEIGRAERRLAARREHLNESLTYSRSRTRVSLGSPKVLLGAFVAGFLLDRLARIRSRTSRRQPRQGSAASGIAAALAAAAVRAVLGNPKAWSSLREMWARRQSRQPQRHTPASRGVYPAALERAPYHERAAGRAQPASAGVSPVAAAHSSGVTAGQR
jgi:hypothetical protein